MPVDSGDGLAVAEGGIAGFCLGRYPADRPEFHGLRPVHFLSLALLSSTIADLPFVLREQVLGYAESVRQALPDIFKDAGVKSSSKLVDEVIYIAGIRKFHGLVASNYWALENSASLLRSSNVSHIRMGTQDFSRGAHIHTILKNALDAVEASLDRLGTTELLELRYVDLVQRLAADGPLEDSRGD